MKTAREIAKSHELRCEDGGPNYHTDTSIVASMEEYANQFRFAQPSDLKELKDITGDEAIMALKLLFKHPNKEYNVEPDEVVIGDFRKTKIGIRAEVACRCFVGEVGLAFNGDFQMVDEEENVTHYFTLASYQYLQSRGYRLPCYFPVQRPMKTLTEFEQEVLNNTFQKSLKSEPDRSNRNHSPVQRAEEKLLMELCDVVSCHVFQGNNFLATDTRKILIERAKANVGLVSSVNEKEAVEWSRECKCPGSVAIINSNGRCGNCNGLPTIP